MVVAANIKRIRTLNILGRLPRWNSRSSGYMSWSMSVGIHPSFRPLVSASFHVGSRGRSVQLRMYDTVGKAGKPFRGFLGRTLVNTCGAPTAPPARTVPFEGCRHVK